MEGKDWHSNKVGEEGRGVRSPTWQVKTEAPQGRTDYTQYQILWKVKHFYLFLTFDQDMQQTCNKTTNHHQPKPIVQIGTY